VTYTSDLHIAWRAADASGAAEALLAREGTQYPTAWSKDGEMLLFDQSQVDVPNRSDIWVMPRRGPPRPLIATPHEERAARLSPDGRWVAYHSNESGRLEVYVRPFPNVDDGKWTISTAGGRRPVWSPDGQELFYALGAALMRVPVTIRGAGFAAGTPEQLFSGPFELATTDFSISPDGKYFVMVESDPGARPTQVQVVLNWTEELTRLAPQ
jgi:serine/threonine-protein kinase